MHKYLIGIVVAATLAASAWAQAPRTIEMKVDGLVCAFCAQGIEKKLRKLSATADVYVNLEHHLVAVALKPDQDITDAALRELLTEAGYTLVNVSRGTEPLDAVRKRTKS